MDKIKYKEKGIEFKNPSPFLVALIKMRNQRAEIIRAKAQRDVRILGLRIDKEMREMANG